MLLLFDVTVDATGDIEGGPLDEAKKEPTVDCGVALEAVCPGSADFCAFALPFVGFLAFRLLCFGGAH